MSLWLDRKTAADEPRACSSCGDVFDWQFGYGSLFVGSCLGCGQPFRDELRARYLELVDAHPDRPSDELARMAAEDYNGWLLAALVAQYG